MFSFVVPESMIYTHTVRQFLSEFDAKNRIRSFSYLVCHPARFPNICKIQQLKCVYIVSVAFRSA